jgi:hypothetical protein
LVGRSEDDVTEIFGGLSAWKNGNHPSVQTKRFFSSDTQAVGLIDSDEDCEKPISNGCSNQQKRLLKSYKWLEARKQLKSDGSSFKKIKAKRNHRKTSQNDPPARRYFDEEAELDPNEDQ